MMCKRRRFAYCINPSRNKQGDKKEMVCNR